MASALYVSTRLLDGQRGQRCMSKLLRCWLLLDGGSGASWHGQRAQSTRLLGGQREQRCFDKLLRCWVLLERGSRASWYGQRTRTSRLSGLLLECGSRNPHRCMSGSDVPPPTWGLGLRLGQWCRSRRRCDVWYCREERVSSSCGELPSRTVVKNSLMMIQGASLPRMRLRIKRWTPGSLQDAA